MKKVIAWDLGTGGNKASLYDVDGVCIASAFVPYHTYYCGSGWHEQSPEDWWKAVAESTRRLLFESKTDANDIYCCSISGHSMGVVPIGKDGRLLRERTPIWSDTRAESQARDFFKVTDETEWYLKTGGGFTPMCYSVFKTKWLQENEPDVFRRIHKVVGTKDYVLFKLTGRLCTDFSYASGSGVWDLNKWRYSKDLIQAVGVEGDILPETVPSTQVIGQIGKKASEEIGLSESTYVVSGGVDDSCMALGAMSWREGRSYCSLGSSPWIALCTSKPLLEPAARPYVFAHVVPGMFVSALCTASGGSAFRWLREQMCRDLEKKARDANVDVYEWMTREAAKSVIGANRLIFNPSLAGGMPLDKSYQVRGGFAGLDLSHTRSDLIRATMEGVAMSLKFCFDKLKELSDMEGSLLLTGGGSKSELWRQIFADVFGISVLKTNVDTQAAALGAAACALVGCGFWNDFTRIDTLHAERHEMIPVTENLEFYKKLLRVYERAADSFSDLGEMLACL